MPGVLVLTHLFATPVPPCDDHSRGLLPLLAASPPFARICTALVPLACFWQCAVGMQTNTPRPWWVSLLAMRLAAGPRSHDLAHWLASHPCPEAATPEPPWLPTPKQWTAARHQADALACLGLHVVPVWHLGAPLRRLRPLPVALFVRGNTGVLLGGSAVAIVGSRQASPAGLKWAHALAHSLASAGHLVVSGGAGGIDTAAHSGALAAGGHTLVFMGTAIDRPYPAANRRLFAKIVNDGGALVSEFAPLDTTYKSAHALRNRFIVARAACVVLAEARTHSGTLSSARWAQRLQTPTYVAPPTVGGHRGGLEAVVAAGWATVWPPAFWARSLRRSTV